MQNFKIFGGDANDAYAHSPGEFKIPTYISIDDQYAEWYEDRYKKTIDWNLVLPLLKAMQGHLEAGRFWENNINSILLSEEFKFTTTTLDCCIYRTVWKGNLVFLLRQVDDFALVCKHEQTAKEIYGLVGLQLQTDNKEEPPFDYFGLLEDFNGVDVHQYRDCIQISCPEYIERFVTSHEWNDEPEFNTTSIKPISPLPDNCINVMYNIALANTTVPSTDSSSDNDMTNIDDWNMSIFGELPNKDDLGGFIDKHLHVLATNDRYKISRAQINTGTDATVTNRRELLHNYQPYTDKFKCHVLLCSAMDQNAFPKR